MCGIAGIAAPGEHTNFEPALQRMGGALSHRGPDSHGSVVKTVGDWKVGLAHTRLAILDLSPAGRQPMTCDDSGCWITYNGETYNFAELRRALESRFDFRSNTDTEVMLRAYEAWGPDALRRFRGMYAFGLLDQRKQSLILARDRMGIKPLYFYRADKLLVFASEIRALLASGLVPCKLSRNGLHSFIRSGSVAAPSTILEGVSTLLPGEYATVRLDMPALSVDHARCLPDVEPPGSEMPFRSRQEAAGRLMDVLAESVRLHLVSDVPLGVFLSGGIDSSAIAALMIRATRSVPRTFCVGFEESEFSEASRARAVAKRLGTEHHEILLNAGRMIDLLPDGLNAMDQPTVDGFNTYVISKAVKDAGITVSLSGLGGDELFGGYPTFRRAAWLRRLGFVPMALRRPLAHVGKAVLNGSVGLDKFWDLAASEASPYSAYAISRRIFADGEMECLVGRSEEPAVHPADAGDDVFNAVSRYEMEGFMANTLLRDADCMSMAHALEVRVPFVDVEVVRFVLSLPGRLKEADGRSKPLLLDALGPMLPDEFWRFPKMGFTLPFARWMTSELKGRLDAAFRKAEGLSCAGIDIKAAQAHWNRFLRDPRKERWARPWTLYVLDRWCAEQGVAQ